MDRSGIYGLRSIIALLAILLCLLVSTAPALADPLAITENSVAVGNITETSAIITWTTDIPATTAVNYGNTTRLDFTISDDTLLREHSIMITGLGPATRYYFEVQSTDQTGENTVTDNNEPDHHRFITDEKLSIGKGLLITAIGMASVFVVLIVIMYLMMFIQSRFGDDEPPAEGEGALVDVVTLSEKETQPVSVRAHGTTELDSVLMTIGVEVQEDPTEIAAISLALAAHLHKKGKELGQRSINIGHTTYDVEVAAPFDSPVAVTVNEDKFWASLDGKGLPVGIHGSSMRVRRIGDAQRGRIGDAQRGRTWRSAYPLPQGPAWDRRGWSKKS